MRNEIRDFILNEVSKHPQNIATLAAEKYGVTRQTIVNYLNKLINEGLIKAEGNTRARQYKLRNFVEKNVHIEHVLGLEEDIVWRENMLPLMSNVGSEVLDICQYGFTEILRNVRDHSGSQSALCYLTRNAICIDLGVIDHGVGIFNKIQKDFKLNDPRHALLELAKGKLTSDPKGHSGEGIFFTSRMFDTFRILSHPLFYSRKSKDESDWLIETGESNQKGTHVEMTISPNSARTMRSVFDIYSPDKETYGFTLTHVPIQLARYEGEQLVSRSQARRLLARFERFDEVLLDFKGVTTIGQAFADEIFRVYHMEHPTTRIFWVNTTQDVENMILRAQSNLAASNG